ncbi:MAG: hypothetical protein HOP28_07080 [Gemmatimonadales bacterium]|nr:hypothetical protein [Gemmatimonadales bacterium]
MSGSLPVRVMVLDTWEEFPLEFLPSTPVSELKRAALARARVRRPSSEYVVKYRGAELYEGPRTLAESGVTANAPLIVLSRGRIPAR